jgi:glycosyltransferase involved in cell wall biosynthesis
VTPDSAAELAAAIERVVSEEGLADRLARQGGAAIAERFSLERSIGAFLGVVREVLPDGLS